MERNEADRLYCPYAGSGNIFPDIRNMMEGTPFILTGEHPKLYFTMNNKLQKIGVYENEDVAFKSLTVDNFFAANFTVRQTNVQNGDLGVSDGGIIEIANGNTIIIKDQTGYNISPFQAGDLIIARRVSPDKNAEIRYVKATVLAIHGKYVRISYTSTDVFQAGDSVIRVGNTTTSSRRDSIFISTNEANTPYIDVYDGISSFSGSGATSWDTKIPKVRIGNLAGVTDADFGGALSGYGIYCPNIYLKGSVLLTNPKSNGINTNYRQSADPSLTNTMIAGDTWVDTDAHFQMYRWNGSGWEDWIEGIGSAASGLVINATNMGYFNGTAWKTYTDNSGNFYLAGAGGGTDGYLEWISATSALTLQGTIYIKNKTDIKTSEITNDSGWGTGTKTSSGSTFPATPSTNDLHWFTGATGGGYTQYNWYRYNGSSWEQLGSNGVYIDSSGLYGGTVAANNIVAGTGIVNALSVYSTLTMGNASTAGTIQSYGWNGTADGFQIVGGATPSITLIGGTFKSGTIAIGSGNSIFKADSNGIYLGNATFASAPFRVAMDGAATMTSATITNGTITGGTVQTATSGQRIVISGSTNTIDFYDASGNVGSLYGYNGMLYTNGTLYSPNFSSPLYSVSVSGAVKFYETSSHYVNLSASGGTLALSGDVGASLSIPNNLDVTQQISAAQLVVGSSKFVVDSSGNITKINNVATSFPASQGGANTYLKNDGSGNLSWSSGSGMVYPGAGIAVSTGSAWGTSINNNSNAWDDAVDWIANFSESDPTIYAWAKASTKPTYTYSEVGAQAALSGTGFVKISGSTISYDNSTYITGNQTITLGGILSGSGTTSITASAATGYYMPSATDQSNWDANNSKVSFPGFGTSHSTAAYGDHNHTGTYAPASQGASFGTTGGVTSPSGYIELSINGVTKKVWYTD